MKCTLHYVLSPVRLVFAIMSDEIDKQMVGGVTGKALLLVYCSEASGSSIDVLSSQT